jgi:hypothetical protein
MEPATDDYVDFALAMLYRRRSVVDGMIQRLEQRENHLSTQRLLAPAFSGHESWARRTKLFECVKRLIRSNLVSPN